jgi:hypothetical protein
MQNRPEHTMEAEFAGVTKVKNGLTNVAKEKSLDAIRKGRKT